MNSFWRSDIRIRQMQPEMMDQINLDECAHRSALRGLVRVNLISLTHRSLWKPIIRLMRSRAPKPIRVLDVACGGGDVTVRLALAARRCRLPISIDGCDMSPTALTVAREHAKSAGVPCQFFSLEVTKEKLPDDYDVVVTSLFMHHLPTESAVNLLRSMCQAPRKLVLVNDLVRSRFGYLLARFGGYLLSRSPIVHSDGPISVAGAFTPQEFQEMSLRAGMQGATVKRIWPARMLLEWSRS